MLFRSLLPADMPSEEKLEHFLTALSKTHITASTQNQAFSAIIFFYKDVLGTRLSTSIGNGRGFFPPTGHASILAPAN